MNDIQLLIDRQLGLCNSSYYDNVLKRLIVSPDGSYNGLILQSLNLAYNTHPPIFACRFAESPGYEHFVAIADEDGAVAIQNTYSQVSNNGEISRLEGVQCHQNAVFDLAWMNNEMRFVTVSGDHTARLWEIGEGAITNVQTFYGHTKSVKTAAFRPQDCSVFATGARDGKILLWDTRATLNVDLIPRPDNCIYNCHPLNGAKTPTSASKKNRALDTQRVNSVTGLVFQDDFTLISCGAGDGSIKVWDLRKNYSTYKRDPLPKHSIPYCGSSFKNGYTNLLLDKSRIRLFASCMDNVIYCFNVAAYNSVPEQRYVGHENATFYIKSSISPDSKYIISGSSDEKAYIWNVKYSDPIVQLNGHSAEVTCVNWCQVGDIKIITCSDDATHKIWKIGKEYPDSSEVFESCGQAKSLPMTDRTNKSRWGTLDRTPQSLKRKAVTCLSSSQNKVTRQSYNNVSPSSPKAGSSVIKRKTKRSLIDMMNNTLPSIKEKSENGENESKKRNIENVECFASSLTNGYVDNASTSKCDKYELETEKCLQSTSSNYCDSYSNQSFLSGMVHKNIFKTPTKSPKKIVIASPESTLKIRSNLSFASSPMIDLPNFVMNGDAPHLRLMSPLKRTSENVDWLTRMTREKRIKTEITNHFTSPLHTFDSGQLNHSPQENTAKGRRNSTSKNSSDDSNKTPGRRKVNTTLLNYFTASNKT